MIDSQLRTSRGAMHGVNWPNLAMPSNLAVLCSAMASRSPLEQLRHHLLGSLGIAPALLLACSGEPPSADEAGVTTNPSSSATLDGGFEEGNDGTTSGGSGVPPNPTTGQTTTPDPDPDPSGDGDPGDGDPGDGDGDGDPDIRLDVAPEPDMPPLGDCTVTQSDPSLLDEYPECPIVIDDGICWSSIYWGCVELQPDQTCADLCVDGTCIADWTNCSGDRVYEFPSEVCGPYEVDGMCCSIAEMEEFCGTDGRPFVVGGVARLASLHGVEPMSGTERVRERLAAHWTAAALAEHASVASFAQFGARLLALGAPVSMVRDALSAAADEVRHAEFARELASRYCGRELAFGALDTRGAASRDESFAETVLACVREGCIGETLAALELWTLAQDCSDSHLAESLRAIAADESRHAALAWRFVQWALLREPSLAPRVAAVFERGGMFERGVETVDANERANERASLRAQGCMPADERRELVREGLHKLVRPCAEALLGSRAEHAQLLASDGFVRLWAEG